MFKISDVSGRKVYTEEVVGDNHCGRYKLFLAMVDVLNKARDMGMKKTLVIYAGSAPNPYAPIIDRMYNNKNDGYKYADFECKFLYIDPATHAPIRKSTHVCDITPEMLSSYDKLNTFTIVGDYFTDDMAKIISASSMPKVFISDIRTCTDDEHVMNDLLMQQKWVEIIKPDIYSLKFRPPFGLSDQGGSFEYLDADAYIQAYPRSMSNETRLVGSSLSKKTWDARDYDYAMHYYNSEVRYVIDNDELIEDKIYSEYGWNEDTLKSYVRSFLNV